MAIVPGDQAAHKRLTSSFSPGTGLVVSCSMISFLVSVGADCAGPSRLVRSILEDVLEECGPYVIRHGFEVRHSPLVGS